MPEREESLQLGPESDDLPPVLTLPDLLPGYAELHCITNFSFQRGASHPHELVERAYNLGYAGLAITDECSMAGVVQAHIGLKRYREEIARLEEEEPDKLRSRPFRLLYGAHFLFDDCCLVALPRDLAGWGDLCEFITAARRKAVKGEYSVDWETSDMQLLQQCEIICVPRRTLPDAMDLEALCARLARTAAFFLSNFWLGAEFFNEPGDELWLALLRDASSRCGVPLVAAGGVCMHKRSRKRLHDVITAVREGRPVADCGFALQPNAQRYLRYRTHLAQLYPPELLAGTLEVMRRCQFTLESIQYNYPMEPVPPGQTPMGALMRLTMKGARRRYGKALKIKHKKQILHELELIQFKKYEMYFLTVEDIVRQARELGILCQGRGSAANSLVCYCLGITEIKPELTSMLFERFISKERDEAPDIDVDFEHQRREEVIQYIYKKYGRDRAAIAAVVVRYRSRMAIRDVGKAMGVDERLVDAFARDHFWFDRDILIEKLQVIAHDLGVQEDALKLELWMALAFQLRGFPRHLSQHVGGFVLTNDKLTRLVPVENASMPDRSIIQWEKDDLEAMNLLKVDVLALGMLSALRRCVQLTNDWRGREASWRLQDIPVDDPRVYDMICRADTVGVFQIESRAQMSMLPRLRPREYYDLVVEVAIVRPGPIQGGMVHPYLKARQRKREGKEMVFAKAELAEPLGRTLGVPIFQEQVMQLAIVAAGFTAGEADRLRRSMAAWKHHGDVTIFRNRLIDGMVAKGYERKFAEDIFKQIEGFGEYGFPESHAASFALLAYFSSWFKFYEPACFLASLLNAQPMGFYSASQLIQDAQRHDVEVRPVDVVLSGVDCSLEPPDGVHFAEVAPGQNNSLQPCVRLGLCMVGGLSGAGAQRIAQARSQAHFSDVEDLALRAGLGLKDMNALAAADALSSLAGHRRQQVWAAAAQRLAPALLRNAPIHEAQIQLPQAAEGEDIVFDYTATGLTLRRHPLALLRPRLERRGIQTAAQLHALPHGSQVHACGIVNMRQRPPTAKGTMFITLEDETGTVNIIVWQHVVEVQRDALLRSRLLSVQGVWQRDVESGGNVRHLLARESQDLTPLLGRLGQSSRSRDFH